MEKAELLTQFQAKVDEFARFHAFIEKAKAQADRFAPEVVEKVITGNQAKAMSVVEDLIPLTTDVEQVIDDLRARRASVEAATEESNLKMQELELRQAIGELDDDAFEKESADLKVELDKAKESVSEIQEEADAFAEALARWTELGVEAGVLNAPAPDESGDGDEASSPDADEPIAALDADDLSIEVGGDSDDLGDDDGFEIESVDVGDIVELHVDDDGADDLAAEAVVDDSDVGVHIEQVAVEDDVSSVFADDDGEDDDEEEDQGDDAETRNEEVLAVDDVLPAEDAEIDILSDDEPLELDSGEPAADIKPRRAVLLQAESSPDEQVHPVTKDVVSIGRGRDNDIQVRNDSKVSRYHCKIYRRGPNYYIEDNKSANGSLVNGELITERRLFGGEEIIVGETFFRFRIMD